MNYKSLFLSLICICLALPLVMSQNKKADRITEETRSVPAFNGIKVGSGIDLIIAQEKGAPKVIVRADDQHIDKIMTGVKNDVLNIHLAKGSWTNWKWKKMEVEVTVEALKSLNAYGGSDIETSGTLKVSALNIKAQGASDLELDITGEALMCVVSGASDVKLSGNIRDFTFTGSGASDLNAPDLEVDNCILTLQGASDARLQVNGDLSVEVHGASDVKITGDPHIVHEKVSGASDFRISQDRF